MIDDAWDTFAALVEERFQATEDRIVAALALAGQKSVANYILGPMFFDAKMEPTYEHGNFQDKMGPLSIVRDGGGLAVARAVVLGRLLRQMNNPETGQHFVTRVLSLQKDGGPKLADRHSPYWQKAGPIGAVAVEYRGDHTILDPTALAFFPKTEKQLATMDEMLKDEKLRREGAGKMADVFAKIDPDEVRREQPNRRWSKGVFPELCPNEDRPDTPFDPRERQTPRALIAAEGKDSNPLHTFVDLFGDGGVRDGTVTANWDKERLTVRVAIKGVTLKSLQPRDAEAEQIHLALDTEHRHTRFFHFLQSASGEKNLWRDGVTNIQTLFKHLSSEQSSGVDITDAAWEAKITPTSDGYEAAFQIPWRSVGLKKPPPVIGFNVWVQGRSPFYEQVFLRPPRWQIAPDPFHFADLYLGETPVTIEEIDFGIPTWGENRSSVVLVNAGEQEIATSLHAENVLSKRRSTRRSAEVMATVPPSGTIAVEVPFYVNPEEKMAQPQRISLIVRHEGRDLFRGHWAIDYAGPLGVYQRYGTLLGDAENPRPPGEADFLEKKVRYICSRIPRFKRLTTRDGAPSDFVLRAEDGSVEFNLMKSGVLDEICAWIAGRFDNDLDRIRGVFYFSHAPFFARHMSWGHRIMAGADPLSGIRGNFAGGGGNCGFHSRVFGGLACHLKLEGKYLPAHGSVSVYGHVISAVAHRGSKALLDADVGHIFLKPDGSDLVTVDEFRANPDVLTTAGPGDLARYYTMNEDQILMQSTLLGRHPKGSFPPNAPQE